MSQRISYIALEGGEDLISPSGTASPGKLRFSRNYECDTQGKYRRIDGYERFSGKPRPSEASYWGLPYTSGTFSIGDVVVGDDSGASGTVLDDTGDALILYNVGGTFEVDEDLLVNSVKKGEADGSCDERAADNDTDDTAYLRAAIEITRNSIAAVPGWGNILGVFQYDGDVYAIRNNAGGTAAVMYKATTAGWALCSLGESLYFDLGSTEFVVGDTISQGITTAEITRVVLLAGVWADGTAEGYITITGRVGLPFSPGKISLGSVYGAAKATTYSVANTFLPSGRFEFVQHNFYGHDHSRRMYGCDGVNKAFEYDGTALTFITTGMTDDKPKHVHVHRNHLFLAFSGGSLQHSSSGEPLEWEALTGAAEFGVGDEITGMLSMPTVMAVWTRNSTRLLYGDNVDNWTLPLHSDEAGAIEWTLQKIGQGIYMDDRGLTSLGAVDVYGDFQANVISRNVHPWLSDRMRSIQSSVRVRGKNQYRLFFEDKEVMTVTVAGENIIGITIQFYDHVPVCCCSSEDDGGFEELYFGSTDGFVYQLDKGTSFDGSAIIGILRTHFNNMGSPANKKRFRKIDLELVVPAGTTIRVSPDFSYGAEDSQAYYEDFTVQSQGGAWDIEKWSEFIWDGASVGTAECRIDGSGTNIALVLVSESIYAMPHTLQGLIVHYDIRGVRR